MTYASDVMNRLRAVGVVFAKNHDTNCWLATYDNVVIGNDRTLAACIQQAAKAMGET